MGSVAGFINTMAGGSFLTVPFLIFMGLPPTTVNGTKRLAIFIQAGVGFLLIGCMALTGLDLVSGSAVKVFAVLWTVLTY